MPRSLGGCLTCRARKLKCDEKRPHCKLCERAGLVCEGYEAQIRFVFYNPALNEFDWKIAHSGSDHPIGGRRLLFSDHQKARTAKFLSQSMSLGDIQQSLHDLELDCLDPGQSDSVYKGPFGAFRAGLDTSSDASYDASVASKTSDESAIEACAAIEASHTTPSPPHVGQTYQSSQQELLDFDDAQPLAAIFDEGFETAWSNLCSGADLFPQLGLEPSPPLANTHVHSPHISDALSIRFNYAGDAIDDPVHYLLDHYKVQTRKIFVPLRVRKSAWEVLHLPCAISVLSELALWKKTSHARMSLFNSVLAVSAFNMDKYQAEPSDFWWHKGQNFRLRAKKELQACLSTELRGPKVSKYKEILMALLTMVTVAVTSGQLQDARYFLLDAEKLVRLKGRGKALKSRKVALLHSIFLFLRVIEESTFTYPIGTKLSSPSAAGELESLQYPSIQSHRVSLGEKIDNISGHEFESGLTCLENDGASMIEQMYGIPVDLLSLISRVTSLANEMMENRYTGSEQAGSRRIIQRSKSLENEIISWNIEDSRSTPAPKDSLTGGMPENNSYSNRDIVKHLLKGMHHAVILYFYRRITNLHPSILQAYVDGVISSLYECERAMKTAEINNCGLVWPAFMAASEALGEARQSKIIQFMRQAAQTSGMRHFDTAADFAQRVMGARNEQGPTCSWIDVAQKGDAALILT